MQIRTPAVAGMFYPSEKNELKKLVHNCFLHKFGPGKLPPSKIEKKIYGVICPHAGYVYSGPIACHSFYSISSESPELFIIIGPNHWGVGCNIAAMRDCNWGRPWRDLCCSSHASNSSRSNPTPRPPMGISVTHGRTW